MKQTQYDFGMIGLGVMGRNFLLNIADHGFSVLGYDKDPEKGKALEKEATADRKVKGTATLEEFIDLLEKPRKFMLLVPAGAPVDAVIEEVLPHLEKGDVIIDGGNSYFADTDRRAEALEAKGINYLGIGVSGGEKGARFGPSLMPGGQKEAYEKVKPIFEAAAAKVNGQPCVTYLGPKSAGNYVKMVHNGIEYGMMQLISEAYDLMKRGLGLGNDQLHQIFARWNQGELQSFLIEITAAIFAQKDDRIEGILVDSILDKAKQKGTGKWTSQHAFDLGIPLSVIDTAVTMRYLSALKDERVKAAEKFLAAKNTFTEDKDKFIQQLENALYFGFIMAYAQGMALLKAASDEMNYNLNLSDVARIWRGGCIIRSGLLEPIRAAYASQPALSNLLMDDYFSKEISTREADMRSVVKFAVENGIPAATLMASLAYFDAYRSKRLPSNLIQAQRDNFGAHTYERIDVEGIFHTQWNG